MITRSAGLPVQIKGLRYLVGSGYNGETKELDETVQQAAKLLEKTFNRDVEIRFNSNRRSGGAWLKNSLPGFSGNCQIGLNAGINNDGIYISTYVKESALKNPALCNAGFLIEQKYCWLYHNTLNDAINWLKENVDTSKILD
jgi:hypothetical protein